MDTIKKRQEEATSSETLADIEETEKAADSSNDTDGPSPDGALDEPDELKNADPM